MRAWIVINSSPYFNYCNNKGALAKIFRIFEYFKNTIASHNMTACRVTGISAKAKGRN